MAGVVVLVGWWLSPPSERSQPPGVLAPDVPEQTAIADAASFEHDAFRITPLAEFGLDARVLGRETYRFDAGAALSPIDLASLDLASQSYGQGSKSDLHHGFIDSPNLRAVISGNVS